MYRLPRFLAVSLIAAATGMLFTPAAWSAEPAPDFSLYTQPQDLVSLPDGRRLNLVCGGDDTSGPTVILETGLGVPAFLWHDVVPGVAKSTHVCAYDRAGLGFSDPGPMPRDTRAVVADLEQLLPAAQLKPPYVLVGQSLGAISVVLYASAHPEQVAGLVLVDPIIDARRVKSVSPSAYEKVLAADGGLRRCSNAVIQDQMKPGLPLYGPCHAGQWGKPGNSQAVAEMLAERRLTRHAAEATLSELDSLERDDTAFAEVAAVRLADMPLTVMSAASTLKAGPLGLTQDEVEVVDALRLQIHEEYRALSGAGVRVTVEDAGHAIPLEKPQTVIDAITDMVAQLRVP